ncbi:uncharacterized protein OCT59_010628 [Rhizophagus irregularis]|uniref:Uncharacterized protein n=3 Tax=Rhizophagus irregularis TaxID=588596 RepID=A0A915ZKQ3_9GLOM|nr:hypothetical protein GLOIN_2v1788338 [Rhizophagus irregularis DAOM 181602=DAOM 197198]EXX61663.1 hypothetical protein RirG_169070 [Rhizophagus irregularis DAOM 197198w]UZO19331.1 hypothetical protein OCT59_010628 [Rhizophagus irregularis]POG60062.1 hypothetical protein GLOIN_2v1788338 [Rhizophagus irregularis DAOM 181602=DAOM 197198]CAB4486576.1 unnamed protein product [Rhizophagus irregularis]CAB5378084.1 unnamed protein product [Rhizophagus irregularis]|eukprot:XP_025166928.1 hypothetical protein GLOIN_2v1788338 [Rhizophagus irregularis DAOM 181602=DAOM 197198]
MSNIFCENQRFLQSVNGARNFAYIQQQVDLNNNYKDTDLHNGNIGNNVTTTQTNDLTCDHQDINDINQVNNNINNNYRDTDLHNENIENNVTTTQANSLLCDHQDMNDNHQDNHINNNYEDTDLHNNNIDDNHQVTRLQHVDSHHIQHQQ